MLATIGRFLLDWFLSKIVAWVGAFIAKMKRRDEIKEESKESVEPLKKAKTEEEIDAAIPKSLDGF